MTDNLQEEIEDKIIDLISLGAGGRLVVFKPENSKTVLTVEKKGGYDGKTLVLNICGLERSEKDKLEDRIISLAGSKNFKAENNFYFLFVYFDIVKQDIENSFLVIPSSELQRASRQSGISKFLVNKKDFVNFLIGECLKK